VLKPGIPDPGVVLMLPGITGVGVGVGAGLMLLGIEGRGGVAGTTVRETPVAGAVAGTAVRGTTVTGTGSTGTTITGAVVAGVITVVVVVTRVSGVLICARGRFFSGMTPRGITRLTSM
jgi:hypothetical protein